MPRNQSISETREIGQVKKVVLRDYGQLEIVQGETESLKIEGDYEVLRMVSVINQDGNLILDMQGGWFDKAWRAISGAFEGTSLKYYLTVKNLEGIFVSGAGRVKMKGLKASFISLILKGAGEMMISGIEAEKLEADLPGAGLISLAGKVVHQDVTLNGAGSYDAPRLESETAAVKLKGVGKASVWVTKDLDATVDGVGAIEYWGDPVTRKSVSGLGKITQRLV